MLKVHSFFMKWICFMKRQLSMQPKRIVLSGLACEALSTMPIVVVERSTPDEFQPAETHQVRSFLPALH